MSEIPELVTLSFNDPARYQYPFGCSHSRDVTLFYNSLIDGAFSDEINRGLVLVILCSASSVLHFGMMPSLTSKLPRQPAADPRLPEVVSPILDSPAQRWLLSPRPTRAAVV
jgi:hypothetical protein